jgi:hypothetical protein
MTQNKEKNFNFTNYSIKTTKYKNIKYLKTQMEAQIIWAHILNIIEKLLSKTKQTGSFFIGSGHSSWAFSYISLLKFKGGEFYLKMARQMIIGILISLYFLLC